LSAAGVRLHHKRLNPKRLRAAVHTAIAQRPGAERIAQAFANAGGPSAAATAIQELVTAPTGDERRSVAPTSH
jgi:UDP:flavonoid glycosyltransferase YjiC (YdhE family)